MQGKHWRFGPLCNSPRQWNISACADALHYRGRLQRKLWQAHRRSAGAIEMLAPGLAAIIKPETWAWKGLILAGGKQPSCPKLTGPLGDLQEAVAVSQCVALSWLNFSGGSQHNRVVLQTEGRGGEPLQLMIEQQETGWISHGDAAEVFAEQQAPQAEDGFQDRQAAALDVVREQWEKERRHTTDHGQLVWFWPAGVGSIAEESPDPTLSAVSPLSREWTHRSEGIGGSAGHGIAPAIPAVARLPPHAIQRSKARRS